MEIAYLGSISQGEPEKDELLIEPARWSRYRERTQIVVTIRFFLLTS